MCRSLYVRLTAADRAEAAKWGGVLMPIYVSIGLLLLVTLFHNAGARDKQMTADAGETAPVADLSHR